MNRPFGKSFNDRRPLRAPAELRADWVSALEIVGRLVGAVMGQACEPGDPDPAFGQSLTRLKVTLRYLEASNFPVDAESARTMAAAFLALARAFGHPAWSPQARFTAAPFLKAGVQCLEGLLAELAERGRRMLGERDGD